MVSVNAWTLSMEGCPASSSRATPQKWGLHAKLPRSSTGRRMSSQPLKIFPGDGGSCTCKAAGQDGFVTTEAQRTVYLEGEKMKDDERDSMVQAMQEKAKQETAQLNLQVLAKAKERSGAGANTRAELMPGLTAKLQAAISALQEGLVERDTEVRLLLLAALTGEHILFIGPPGTAKSELGRRLATICRSDDSQESKFFERLLTRFSVPEELFGPLSMRALEDDQYVRQIDGYLPDATVAFVDEIFKANSAILNTLLTILNERLFDNGNERIRVPLLCLVGASNELPESEELDALYDRFLLRRQVSQVSAGGLQDLLSNAANLQALASQEGGLTGGTGAPHLQEFAAKNALTASEFAAIKEAAVKTVEVPLEVINILAELRTWLQEKAEPPVYVSDRRLVKSVGLMQVAAYTSGRTQISRYDCLLLKHVLWQQPDEARRIEEWLLKNLATSDGVGQSEYLFQGLYGRACVATSPNIQNRDSYDDVQEEIAELREVIMEKLVEVTVQLASEDAMKTHSLWLGDVEVGQLAASLGPKLDETRDELQKLLHETTLLLSCMQQGGGALAMAAILNERWADFIRKGSKSEVRSR